MNTTYKHFSKTYDCVVVGGGMAGICTAIAAARGGVSTALIQNRPVLGGNASSEIRMHICGAGTHGHPGGSKETGILEEILLENELRNPQESYSIFDMILWEKVHFEENIDLFLNTHMTQVHMKENDSTTIESITAQQLTTESFFTFNATYFVDATGDGTLSALAGADYMMGREGKNVFNESFAQDESDDVCMGNTLLFTSKDMGKPMNYNKPFWANTYTEEDLVHRNHGAFGHNYWWIELGGDEENTIYDGENIRNELLKAVYGVWDHVKNTGDHHADNYVLDWVGFLPGKRESRRIIGDYILKQNDLMSSTIFDDTVAFGGWSMDMHVPGGIRTRLEPTEFIHVPDVYGIPYRSLYSKTISNLLLAGRIISASHMAFGSIRVMATCAVVGQAVGTSLRFLKEDKLMPRDMLGRITELKQLLVREDAFIPGELNTDPMDFAKNAIISGSSHTENHPPELVIDGMSRNVYDEIHCWESSSDSSNEDSQWLKLSFKKTTKLTQIELKFDSNLSREVTLTLFKRNKQNKIVGIPDTLVKDYTLDFYNDNELVESQKITDNHLRYRVHKLTTPADCTHVECTFHSTHGITNYRVFEVRAY